MGLFDSLKTKVSKTQTPKTPEQARVTPAEPVDTARLAELALKSIQDGVIIVDKDEIIKFINPAAVAMTGVDKAEDALYLQFPLVMKLEFIDGTKVDSTNNSLEKAARANQQFESKDFVLIGTLNDKKTPIKVVLTPTGGPTSDRIITFRDIAKELEEEGAQTEFVSTASHEMRTPIASIEGYLSLALNPQTATIDARARQYIESAHDASKRLGNLFKDLLDVTKLDDKRIRARLIPLELNGFVKKFADEYIPKFKEKNITYTFGTESKNKGRFGGGLKKIEQVVYTFADVDFLGEILANLIENAIKYTPVGGAVWINVQGDGDRALINVTDTGIGIASEDLQHIFQKFYRADNSQTRTVGGTGLGLYLVKQRTEAMDGRVWAESAFGEGSTFYVSLPRLTPEEYEKRQIAHSNQVAVQMFAEQAMLNQSAKEGIISSSDPNRLGTNVPQFNPNVFNQRQPIYSPSSAPVRGYGMMVTPNQPNQVSPQSGVPIQSPMPQQSNPMPNVQLPPQQQFSQPLPPRQPVPVQVQPTQPVQNNQNIIQ